MVIKIKILEGTRVHPKWYGEIGVLLPIPILYNTWFTANFNGIELLLRPDEFEVI